MRIPDAGTCFPTVFARFALMAAVLGLLAGHAAALEPSTRPLPLLHAFFALPAFRTAVPAKERCGPDARPSAEPAALALARSAMQARYRPVYWNSFQVPDSLLRSRLDILARRAPSFAAALDSIRRSGFLLLIATADQADLILGLDCIVGPVADGVLGDVGYFEGSRDSAVIGAFIRVNIRAIRAIAPRRVTRGTWSGPPTAGPAIDEAAAARRTIDEAFLAIIDDVLIHEVWGHVVPVAAVGNFSGRCFDPEPGEDPRGSCVIKRENLLRAELGLMPRAHYGILDGLLTPSPIQ